MSDLKHMIPRVSVGGSRSAIHPATSWMDRSACRGVDGFTEMDMPDQLDFCGECPVRSECLDFAVVTHGPRDLVGGVYGGLDPRSVARLAGGGRR